MSKLVETLITALEWAQQGTPIKQIAPLIKRLDECPVKVWREDETVKLPTYAKEGDACMDVYVHKVEFKSDGRVVYHTGLHFALPEDYEMTIRPRSSNTKTTSVMQNSPGTLDGGYRGELLVVMRDMIDPSLGKSEYSIGDRCAQISIRRRERIVWEEVKTLNELGETDRGQGGFGHTGK